MGRRVPLELLNALGTPFLCSFLNWIAPTFISFMQMRVEPCWVTEQQSKSVHPSSVVLSRFLNAWCLGADPGQRCETHQYSFLPKRFAQETRICVCPCWEMIWFFLFFFLGRFCVILFPLVRWEIWSRFESETKHHTFLGDTKVTKQNPHQSLSAILLFFPAISLAWMAKLKMSQHCTVLKEVSSPPPPAIVNSWIWTEFQQNKRKLGVK